MKTIFPIILLIASAAIFIFFTNGEYQAVKSLQSEIADYQKAFGKSNQVLQKRSDLEAKYAQFATGDLDALNKMLPDHIDNVQLILDINGIARDPKLAMPISKIKIEEDKSGNANNQIGPDSKLYSSMLVSFRTKATYPKFVAFMKKIEQGLRLVDVTSLSFKTDTKSPENEYVVTIRTYWLK